MWAYTDRDAVFPEGPDSPNRPLVLPESVKLDENRKFPAGTIANASLPPERRLSWIVTLLPYVGKDDVHKQFELTKGWEDDANRAGVCTLVPVLVCPSQYEQTPPGTPIVTHFSGMAGLGPDAPALRQRDARAGILRYDDATRIGSIKRGFSRTIAVLETGSNLGPWAAGGPSTVRGLDSAAAPYIGPGRPYGGHPRGANAVFADGSVRFLENSISPRILEMLVTLAEPEEK